MMIHLERRQIEKEREKNIVRKLSSLTDTCRLAAGCLAWQSNEIFLKRVGQREIENQVRLTLHWSWQTGSK